VHSKFLRKNEGAKRQRDKNLQKQFLVNKKIIGHEFCQAKQLDRDFSKITQN
jgi:hypothetical protein